MGIKTLDNNVHQIYIVYITVNNIKRGGYYENTEENEKHLC